MEISMVWVRRYFHVFSFFPYLFIFFFLLSVEEDAFSLCPAPLPYLPCFSSVSCLFLEPFFAYLPNSSKIWIWSAGLSMQLIKFSRGEDRVKESPLARTGHFSLDTRWTPGRSGGLCVCR
ncbi:hypothetical protein GOODEAATRI_033672 [Goodea atripinnis]|uniref:Secreted protein n=1 Tax=Goodea atripinnis TaxID=208336 RepID=A0ABV0PJ75_9TELE